MGATSSRLEKALAEYPGNLLGPEVQQSQLYPTHPAIHSSAGTFPGLAVQQPNLQIDMRRLHHTKSASLNGNKDRCTIENLWQHLLCQC